MLYIINLRTANNRVIGICNIFKSICCKIFVLQAILISIVKICYAAVSVGWGATHCGVVRCVADEEPLVTGVVLGVQSVHQVTRLLLVQTLAHQLVVMSPPLKFLSETLNVNTSRTAHLRMIFFMT